MTDDCNSSLAAARLSAYKSRFSFRGSGALTADIWMQPCTNWKPLPVLPLGILTRSLFVHTLVPAVTARNLYTALVCLSSYKGGLLQERGHWV